MDFPHCVSAHHDFIPGNELSFFSFISYLSHEISNTVDIDMVRGLSEAEVNGKTAGCWPC